MPGDLPWSQATVSRVLRSPQRRLEMAAHELVGFAVAEIDREHRAVQRGEPAAGQCRAVERGEIAEPREHLAARAHASPVDRRQDARDPVASACGQHHVDGGIVQQLVKSLQAFLVGAREVAPLPASLPGNDDPIARQPPAGRCPRRAARARRCPTARRRRSWRGRAGGRGRRGSESATVPVQLFEGDEVSVGVANREPARAALVHARRRRPRDHRRATPGSACRRRGCRGGSRGAARRSLRGTSSARRGRP